MRSCILFTVVFFVPYVLFAQSREAGDRGATSLQAGVEFSAFNADFYCPGNSPFSCGGGYPLIKGIAVFADYNQRAQWGVEGEGRWLPWDGFAGQIESSLLIGPHYRFYRWHRVSLWGKFLVGRGDITTAYYPGPNTRKGSFLVYAPGASADVRLSQRVSARVDYEAQRWPNFGVSPQHNHGTSPNGFSAGVAYRLFH